MEEMPLGASFKEESEWLDKYIAEKKKEELFGSGNKWSEDKSPTGEKGFFSKFNWFSDDDEPAQVVKRVNTNTTGKSNPLKGMSTKEIVPLQLEFIKKFKTKKIPKVTDEVFLEFVRGKQK